MPAVQQNIAPPTFGATSTTDDVLEGVNLRGKRVLVTGVSAGLEPSAFEFTRGSLRCVSSPLVGEEQGGGSHRPPL